MSISSCYSKINSYNNLKSDLSQLATELDYAVNYLLKVVSDLQSEYEVNLRETTVYYETKNLRENILETSNYLKSGLTNSINSEIVSLQNEIKKKKNSQEMCFSCQVLWKPYQQ